MLRRLLRAPIVFLALALLLAVWGTLIEPQLLVVRHETLTLPGWTGAPMRVALISDLHVGSPFNGVDKVARVATAVAAEHPDLVLLLGDYAINKILGGEKVAPKLWTPLVGQIPAPLGVYAVLGNHDWWNDAGAYRRSLRAAGVVVMENDAVELRGGEAPVWLVGLGDNWTGHANIGKAFSAVPKGAFALAMAHEPDIVDSVGARADLVLAGHTHGGQVYIPWLSAHLLNLRFRRGLYRPGGVPLFITSGVGMSVWPVRFAVPPEVVILEVR